MAETTNSDHDLLIRLDTKMDRSADDIKSLAHRVEGVRHDVAVMADSMEVKIAAAVSGKADMIRVMELKKDADTIHEDHETRIRWVEKAIWSSGVLGAAGGGGLGVAAVYVIGLFK